MYEFAKWMKEERLRQGLRQKDLAEKSGIAVTTIQNTERAVRGTSLYAAESMAFGLGYELRPVKVDE